MTAGRGEPNEQRATHLQVERERELGQESERARRTLEELEIETFELAETRALLQERIVDLQAALAQTRDERDAADTQARHAATAIAAMKAGLSWRITAPLRLLAAAARRLGGRAAQPR
jgi:chromosome segregation ATPase